MVIYGDQHPFTLAASINYASDLAACGELAEAIRIGQDTLANCRGTLGPDHPDTLMAAVNLAIDVAGLGQAGPSGAAPRGCPAPVRGDADHGTSRGAEPLSWGPGSLRRSSRTRTEAGQVADHPLPDVGDQPQQVRAVDRGVAEALAAGGSGADRGRHRRSP